MKTQENNTGNESIDVLGDLYMENTNPFQRNASFQGESKTSKPGKRPRILKPLYSVRLS
ncbi:hypothetical protein [Dyadobacter sp. CY323]|uniref:hypothetical protein n=1 Tax=Dyadobacter sp. CY323 TaxID=2907302 RepID=UPI001F40A68F|nr:hypothetical protein [Dyadobacter sp. CY323]MCE6987961.1 hypothetical protein [Dyadobacter sp. CY323]